MFFVVMLEGKREILDRRLWIGFWHKGDVIALHRRDEALSHTIALSAADRRRERAQAEFCGEVARLLSDIARSVIGQPFNSFRCFQCGAEAVFYGGEHHIPDHIAAVPTRRCNPTYRLAIAAVECERHAQRLTVIATKLEPIRAPR